MCNFFFFNDTATTEIYTLSLHDALPIYRGYLSPYFVTDAERMEVVLEDALILIHEKKISVMKDMLPLLEQVARSGKPFLIDRKSTRLNSSHSQISYAVFCLKKKKIHLG